MLPDPEKRVTWKICIVLHSDSKRFVSRIKWIFLLSIFSDFLDFFYVEIFLISPRKFIHIWILVLKIALKLEFWHVFWSYKIEIFKWVRSVKFIFLFYNEKVTIFGPFISSDFDLKHWNNLTLAIKIRIVKWVSMF